jgi:cupin fold WbuC family metalloprotein
VKILSPADLRALSTRAASSTRRRANENLHPSLEDPVQRFCNAVEPGSYVRPHRHPGTGRWELFLILAGRAAILVFDEVGTVHDRVELCAGEGGGVAVEVPPDTWHSLVALEPGTVLFELKPGPYRPIGDKDFAAWAPAEGEEGADSLAQWYREARPGDRAPASR